MNANGDQAVIYARLSREAEGSVSIERQKRDCRALAAERGWEVIDEFIEEGSVSATKTRPEERNAWRALLDSPLRFDHVILWHPDRLSRDVLDTLTADLAIKERGADFATVRGTLSTKTADDELTTLVQAAVSRNEARRTSERVRASRRQLMLTGRATGQAPYGWVTIPNPDPAVGGRVYAHDQERIHWVREMADRALQGWTIYAITQWLDQQGAPLPRASQQRRTHSRWNYDTVERLLRNPILAGLTPYNPGNTKKRRGPRYLTDENGEYRINSRTAILPYRQWKAMVQALDNRDSAQAKPRAHRAKTRALLSGLVQCGECDQRMYRGTRPGRTIYYCPRCYQVISGLNDYVVKRYLEETGGVRDFSRLVSVDESDGNADRLASLEVRLEEVGAALGTVDDEAEEKRLFAERDRLRERRKKLRQQPRVVRRVEITPDPDSPRRWEDADDDRTRREFLDEAISRVTIRRGTWGGRGIDTARVTIHWRHPEPTQEQREDMALANLQLDQREAEKQAGKRRKR